jgi:hypothetical protein
MIKMKRFISTTAAALTVLALPAVVAAQGNAAFGSVDSSISTVTSLINRLIPLVIGIGVLVFLWGLVGYVTAGGDEEKRKNARSLMIYGIIVLFVMVSVWGLVRILVTTFGTDSAGSNGPPIVPQI